MRHGRSSFPTLHDLRTLFHGAIYICIEMQGAERMAIQSFEYGALRNKSPQLRPRTN